MAASLRICIDVPSLHRGIEFYRAAFGLEVSRRLGDGWAELSGGPCPIDLLAKSEGSAPSPRAAGTRTYARHWTPLHLDFEVADLDEALKRALAAGAVLEGEVQDTNWGRLANLADPFGHGLCLIQFVGRGYDELLDGTKTTS